MAGKIGPDNLAPINLRDRLMPKTHSENWQLPSEVLNCFQADPCLIRCTWSRRQDERLRRKIGDFMESNPVTINDRHIRAFACQIAREIMNETVAIVEHEDHAFFPTRNRDGAIRSAFSSDSASSPTGSDIKVIPPPANSVLSVGK